MPSRASNLRALIVFAALSAAATPALSAVFGKDQRQRLNSREIALQSRIGTLISAQSGALCSAFCVAPDLIATASHCLFGTSAGGKPDITTLEFRTGLAGPESAGTGIAGRTTGTHLQNIISGTQRLNLTPPIDADRDWAIARLERPACTAGGLPLRDNRQTASPDAQSAPLYQVAAHRDLNSNELFRSAPCPADESFADAAPDVIARDFRDATRIVLHTCDTGGGSSGSPMLVEGANGAEVAGINVGTYVVARTIVAARDGTAQPQSQAIANTAILPGAFRDAIATLGQRKIATDPQAIREIARQLTELKFYSGPVNGASNAALERAVMSFERATGRPATGLLRIDLSAELAAHRARQASSDR